jgi:hypothetical protein
MYRQKQLTVPNFLTEQNVSMLLEIILDEDFMQVQSSDVIDATKFVFYNNIRGFYENEKANVPDLVELNKQYIMLILRHVKSDLINKPPPVNTSKQRVTFEEIQKDKRSQFERDLNARQSEFTSAMTLPVPPVPKFSDAAQDEPLSEMELVIKQMTEQRKYDVEQIANSFTGNTLAPPEETSINNEKFRRPIINPGMQPQSQQNPGVRYIKIENSEAKLDDAAIVDLTKKEDDSSLFERNIFSKLKKVDDSAVLSNLQNEVKELGAKVETINRDISKILDLLSNPK